MRPFKPGSEKSHANNERRPTDIHGMQSSSESRQNIDFLTKNYKSLSKSIVFPRKMPKFSVRIKTIEYAR